MKHFRLVLAVVVIASVGYYTWLSSTTTPTATIAGAIPKSGVDLAAIDNSTRPQDDFYQWVNGAWLDNTEIPSIYSGYSVYTEVYEEAEQTLQQIVEDSVTQPTDAENAKIGDLYASWMDIDALNALGITPIQPELDIIAGINDRATLIAAIATLSRMGIDTPYSHGVGIDDMNSTQYAYFFSQDGLTLPNRDYYLATDNERFAKARDALPAYIGDLLEVAGYSRADADAQASAVYDMEYRIAEAHWSAVENRDPQKRYNAYTIGELTALGEHFDWPLTLDTLGVSQLDRIIIGQPSYFQAMDGMINDVSLDTWKAYLTYRVIDGRGSNLTAAIDDIIFNYRGKLVGGQQEQRPRWKRGISLANNVLGEAIGKQYVAQRFPPEAKAKMQQLVDNVIATFRADIDKLEWMSAETRDKAKEKLGKFTAKIGYPDEWKDYSQLQIVRGDHLGNIRRHIEFEYQRDIAKLGGPIDRNEWFMTPQTVNAYYSPSRNEIVFPAARLQPPFFQLDADDAINYGAVGGVIGHEISHGFDDKGSQYDGDGNLRNWWTESDREAFDARTRELVEQYNRFEPLTGMHVNGELTLGENIGDLSGVTMAYRAYVRSLNGKEAPVIDGFTGAQRFFIGYAISRKGKYTEESTTSRLASDPHSPLKYRVNGVYPNIDAFYEAFDVQPGDGMYLPPESRVRLW